LANEREVSPTKNLNPGEFLTRHRGGALSCKDLLGF